MQVFALSKCTLPQFCFDLRLVFCKVSTKGLGFRICGLQGLGAGRQGGAMRRFRFSLYHSL